MSLLLIEFSVVALLASSSDLSVCESIPHHQECLQSFIEDDVAGWSAGEDTLTGRALRQLGKPPPASLAALANATYLPRPEIQDGCRESFAKNTPCVAAFSSAISSWCDGKPSPVVERVVTARAKLARSFKSKGGYQNSRWGMTQSEVRRLYPKVSSAGADALALSGELGGQPALVGFRFTRDKLSAVVVMFQAHYMNPNNYVRDYAEFKALLIKKYGEPGSDRAEWSQTRNQDDPERIGTAVALGQVVLTTSWEQDVTRVDLTCDGEDAQARVVLTYLSKELEYFAAQSESARVARGL